jgi:hypothetical protein
MSTQAEKVRENRLRRAAARQGLTLNKSRRRDPRALDYGLYSLTDNNNVLVVGGCPLDQIESWLTGEQKGADHA